MRVIAADKFLADFGQKVQKLCLDFIVAEGSNPVQQGLTNIAYPKDIRAYRRMSSSPKECIPLLPLSWSKVISPRGRFGKPGRFSRNFEIIRLFRQEISSCQASLRISRQNENLPLDYVEKLDTKIVGVNPLA